MRKTIGIVAEGPRDYDMIASIIDSITGEEHNHLRIQPQPDASGEFGNGWKGVWKWCETHQDDLSDYFYSISPKLDLLIIHMDGDVARKEKQVHCFCEPVDCDVRENVHPLKCERFIKKECPIELPCPKHEASPRGYATFLTAFLMKVSGEHGELPVCFLTPCDSTEAWIVAACEEREDYETIEDPWEAVICHSARYFGVKIKNRPNKNQGPYQELVSFVNRNWNTVMRRCPQAEAFNNEVIRHLVQKDSNEGSK